MSRSSSSGKRFLQGGSSVTQFRSVPSGEINAELERILLSGTFANADRMKRFLRFVVDQSLQGKGDQLNEYLLGVDVYDRDETFDPRIDSIVRVDATRLRSKLREYYEFEGRSSTLRIEIPKGHYKPLFKRISGTYGQQGLFEEAIETLQKARALAGEILPIRGALGDICARAGRRREAEIGLGAGWRGYWVNRSEGRDSRHGIDFARLQVGVDVPVTTGVTLSPFAGATATLFLTQQLAQESSFSNIPNPNVNVFFNAGVMGRFDVLGSASPRKADL